MNLVIWLLDRYRQRQMRSLASRIVALHPELARFEGEGRIDYYMRSCYRYFAHQRSDETRSDEDFNESGSNLHPTLRREALDYLSTRSASSYHFDLLQAQMKIQDLTLEVEKGRMDLLLKDQQIALSQQYVEITNQTFQAMHPEKRQN